MRARAKPLPLADRPLAKTRVTRRFIAQRLEVAEKAARKPLERVAIFKAELAKIDRLIEILEEQRTELNGAGRGDRKILPIRTAPPPPPAPGLQATPLWGGLCVHCIREHRLGKSLYGYKCIGLIREGKLKKAVWNRCHCGNAKQAVHTQCDRCVQLAAVPAK